MTPSATLQRLILSVSDLDRAIAFYVGALGLQETDRTDGLAWLRTGDGVEVMLHERRPEPSDTAVAAGFATVGLEDAVDRCVGAGGVVVDEVETRPWGERMAVLRDPDGHLLCVSEGR